jgi:hypothetical protein
MIQDRMPNWDDFEKMMANPFDFLPKDYIKRAMRGDTGWVDDYVRGVSKRFLRWDGISYELHDAGRTIHVRCRVPDRSAADEYRFAASRYKLRITRGDRVEVVSLPACVDPDRSSVHYNKGMIEIRLPKTGKRERFQEIPLF